MILRWFQSTLAALLLTAFSLSAEENLETLNMPKAMVDAIYQKLVSTMFIHEFEHEKNKTTTNQQKIEFIQKRLDTFATQMQLLMEEEKKNTPKTATPFGTQPTDMQVSSRIEKLEFEQEEIKKMLLAIQNQLNTPIPQSKPLQAPSTVRVKKPLPDTPFTLYQTGSNEINIKSRPIGSSPTIATLPRYSNIKISGCDAFAWCKLADRAGYVAGHLIYKLEQ